MNYAANHKNALDRMIAASKPRHGTGCYPSKAATKTHAHCPTYRFSAMQKTKILYQPMRVPGISLLSQATIRQRAIGQNHGNLILQWNAEIVKNKQHGMLYVAPPAGEYHDVFRLSRNALFLLTKTLLSIHDLASVRFSSKLGAQPLADLVDIRSRPQGSVRERPRKGSVVSKAMQNSKYFYR